MNTPYHAAQQAIATLKGAIYSLLAEGAELKNAEIGKMLGIHKGHANQHAGHITRTLLEMMQAEGVVDQHVESKLWFVCAVVEDEEEDAESFGEQ